MIFAAPSATRLRLEEALHHLDDAIGKFSLAGGRTSMALRSSSHNSARSRDLVPGHLHEPEELVDCAWFGDVVPSGLRASSCLWEVGLPAGISWWKTRGAGLHVLLEGE